MKFIEFLVLWGERKCLPPVKILSGRQAAGGQVGRLLRLLFVFIWICATDTFSDEQRDTFSRDDVGGGKFKSNICLLSKKLPNLDFCWKRRI